MKTPSATILALFAMLALITGCAWELKEKESAATAAGFQVITPVKADQVALLTSLPKGKVSRTTYQGKTYFVLPDVKNNRAYVGGAKEYQAYKQLRVKQEISDENMEAAQMNQMAAQDWGAWGGWGGYGGVPWGLGVADYGRVGAVRR